jgi:hypothetical protein
LTRLQSVALKLARHSLETERTVLLAVANFVLVAIAPERLTLGVASPGGVFETFVGSPLFDNIEAHVLAEEHDFTNLFRLLVPFSLVDMTISAEGLVRVRRVSCA